MKRYVEQLIEDLEGSFQNSKQKLKLFFDNTSSHEYFPITDDEEGGIKVSDLIGMEKFMFPHVDYLNEVEAGELTSTMLKIYKAYGLNPIFSLCIPDKIKYGLLRDYLSIVTYPLEGRLVDVEMCDYLPVHCPYGSICPETHSADNCCEKNINRA